jgi:hypothetical protein
MTPPPFSATEPVPAGVTWPVRLQDYVRSDNPPAPATGDGTASVPFKEIGGGVQDRLTHDYMDDGQFEHTSPATEAVKRVRRKVIAREGQDKPRHLLEWVD